MTTESSLFHPDPEDIFAKAIERVEAGEAIEAVLATTPEAMRAELRDLLLLITATHHLQRAPVPQPTAPRRADRKAAFLEAAAQMKPVAAVVSTPVHPPVPAATVAKAPLTKLSFGAWLQNFWNDLQIGFASPNLRLAPLVIIIAAVWLGSFGFVNVAAAAGIGDLAYPVKQWIRNQQLNLSSETARGPVYKENVDKIIYDLTLTTAKLSAEKRATGYRVAKISTELLIFDELAADHLVLGPLHVMMSYQPDPNRNEYVSMAMPVMPGKGQQVELTFQIVPADDPNAPLPFILQGIRLTVPEVQLAIGPTPTAEPPAATSTATATATPCDGVFPAGWVPYVVRNGDSLSAIAQRTGTTLAELQQVNCLVNANDIVAGNRLMAPALQQLSTPTAAQPPLAATLTAISTTVLTPSVAITATVTVVLTDTVTVSPTATVTENVTITVTAEVTPIITSTVTISEVGTPTVVQTVVQTPTPPMTVTITSAAGDNGTIVATETLTDGIDPAPGTPIAPTAETTVAATVESTASTPESGEASPTPSPTPINEPPTATTVPEPTLVPILEPTSQAAEEPTTAPPTDEPKQSNSGTTIQVTLPTPTRTPIPQNHSPLTGG